MNAFVIYIYKILNTQNITYGQQEINKTENSLQLHGKYPN